MEKLIAGTAKLGLLLSPRQIEQFQIFYEALVDWNQRINLTSIVDYEDVQTKHFLDSLTLTLEMPSKIKGIKIIDVGTGAGIPGLPLKIIYPDIKLTLLEATAKKATFLHHVIDTLKLEDVAVLVGRAEDLAQKIEYREYFDIILARGVAKMAALAELTLPFCTLGGSFIAQKKGDLEPELSQAGNAIKLMGGELRNIIKITMDEFTDERVLIVIDKVSLTPAQYPRRPGMPAKNPLL